MDLPAYVCMALEKLNTAGYACFLVGGCVRDALMGAAPADYDIAAASTPAQTAACFAGCHVIETGVRHGTVTVVIDDHPLEITTFREDGAYLDHRRPSDVRFTQRLEADLARRDFTVNAMAYHPETGLVDLFGGREDLRTKTLRAVGDPAERFREDALRILRALRFASVLDFAIEPATVAAVHAHAPLLAYVSAERVFSELKKLLCGVAAGRVLRDYYDIFTQILPPLGTLPAADHARAACYAQAFSSPVQAFAGFLCLCGEEAAVQCYTALKTDKRFLNETAFLVRNRLLRFSSVGEAKRFIGKHGEALCALLPDFRDKTDGADSAFLRAALAEPDACRRISDLKIGGRDLQRLGFSGQAVGTCLEALLVEVTEGRLENTRKALTAAAQTLLK